MANKPIIKKDKFILCDDIRKEDNGKLIFIGVYPDDTINIFGDMPAHLGSLYIFVRFTTKFRPKKFKWTIISPDKSVIFESPFNEVRNVESEEAKDISSITLLAGLSPIQFNLVGKYNLHVDFVNNKKVIPFYVRQKK